MQISERCLSKNIERRTTTRSPTQTKTPETTKHNGENQQIQDFISGHLYEITKKLMDLKPSNSTTRLTNDQVKPKKIYLIFQWIIFLWIQRENIHKHISNDSPSAFKLKPHMASVHGYLRTWILLHLPVPRFLHWYVFFNYSNQSLIYLCWSLLTAWGSYSSVKLIYSAVWNSLWGTSLPQWRLLLCASFLLLRLSVCGVRCLWTSRRSCSTETFWSFFLHWEGPPRTEAGGPTDNVPSPSCEPRETASATKSCSPETAGAFLHRINVRHMTG